MPRYLMVCSVRVEHVDRLARFLARRVSLEAVRRC
jgi:hypothetical protein